ncbi:hypothetical protein PRECH8_04610 [Insulibacter thermoxylanivorax]|uniref:Uncharacterized protein n=1 Tax=Insulibacter thermoxylanivorax TaxID=2749268 RepID=A0A916QAI2_9BACL|nr:hypothetical protein PRECH8_04610 [Insulibacter thermoxylanivorax]
MALFYLLGNVKAVIKYFWAVCEKPIAKRVDFNIMLFVRVYSKPKVMYK